MAKRDIGRPYWLPAAVALTSTANEVKFGVTLEAKADLSVIGAITDLLVSAVKLKDFSGEINLASEYLPILSLFGKRDSARNTFFWPKSLPLGFGNRIEVEVKNAAAGAEGAGHVIYVGVPNEPPQVLLEGELPGTPRAFSIDSKFSAVANEQQTSTSPDQDADFLIHGAFTDLASAHVRIRGVSDESFMNDWTPIWAVAGKAGSQLPVNLWPRPYLIPKGSTISVDFKNVGTEASGKLYLVGHKLPAGQRVG